VRSAGYVTQGDGTCECPKKLMSSTKWTGVILRLTGGHTQDDEVGQIVNPKS
jgi:hypothetical protein